MTFILEVIGNNFFLHEGHDAKRTPRKAFNFVFLRVTSWKNFIPDNVYYGAQVTTQAAMIKNIFLALADRLGSFKRFIYPILVLLLAIFACTGYPLPVFLQGYLLIALVGLGILALTFYWFDRVGPRLHERDWQRFAAEHQMTFEPRLVENGAEVSARVTGLYRHRSVSLESFRRIHKRDGREGFFMHCAVSVKAPVGTVLALHSITKNDKKGKPFQTGDSKFTRRFGLSESHPANLVASLFQSAALRKRFLSLARRPVWLRLKEGQLIYQDRRSHFAGVEMDKRKLNRAPRDRRTGSILYSPCARTNCPGRERNARTARPLWALLWRFPRGRAAGPARRGPQPSRQEPSADSAPWGAGTSKI